MSDDPRSDAERTLELPEDLRQMVLEASQMTGLPLAWFIGLYQRGFNAKMGATGAHPFGKLDPQDEGELQVAIGVDKDQGVIRMVFGKPIGWLAFPSSHGRHMAKLILAQCDALDRSIS